MTLNSMYSLLTFFTALVIIGVVMEGEELYSELKSVGWKWKHVEHKFAKIGFAVLVTGLAGELFFQTKIKSADAELKRKADIEIIDAKTKAATALDHAGKAERETSKLLEENMELEKSLERYPIKLHRNRMRRSSSCTLAA